jgi:hypothetical protein
MPDVTPEPIFHAWTGFMASKHLFVANEIGLFEQMAVGPATLEELATRTAVPRRTLRVIADAMVALGLARREDGQYSNTPVTATFLSGNGRADLRPFVSMGNDLLYARWLKFEEAIRTDQRILGEFDFTEHEQEIFSKGVEAASAGDAQALAAGYDFSQHARLLDLGGGTGSFLIAVLGRHPHLKATLFELPAAARSHPNVSRTTPSEAGSRSQQEISSKIRSPRTTTRSSWPTSSTASRRSATSSCSAASANASPTPPDCCSWTFGPIRPTPSRCSQL